MQTKAEVSELVSVTSDIRRQLKILTEETATVKEVCVEIKLMRSEMQQAQAAAAHHAPAQAAQGCRVTASASFSTR